MAHRAVTFFRMISRLIFLIAALLLVFSISFECYFMAFWAAMILAALFSLEWAPKPLQRLRPVLPVLALVFPLFGFPLFIREMQARIDSLSEKLESQGPDSFTTGEKGSLYGLGLAMSAGGLIFYPEVAREQFLLQWKGLPRREWRSDFAMRSEKIRLPLRDFEVQLRKLDPSVGEFSMKAKRIAFVYGRDPARVTLALNPCLLEANARRDGPDWKIEASATVPVHYPQRARVPLFSFAGRTLWMEEGLFWMLQQKGWFFPYEARWNWDLKDLDPRFKSAGP
jgi:hypothetical protein